MLRVGGAVPAMKRRLRRPPSRGGAADLRQTEVSKGLLPGEWVLGGGIVIFCFNCWINAGI